MEKKMTAHKISKKRFQEIRAATKASNPEDHRCIGDPEVVARDGIDIYHALAPSRLRANATISPTASTARRAHKLTKG
jgi:hypothetical protein